MRQPIGTDSLFYAMAGEVPGFAGFVFDGADVAVYLTDSARHGTAAAEMVARYLETTRGRRPAVILVRPARYDFRQLFAWKAAFFTSPPDVGMTRAGVCVRENQVCIGIAPGRGTAEALASADQLGIPRAALKLFEAAVIEVGEKPGTTPRRDGGTRRP